MARTKKKEVTLKYMTFYCGYLEKEVTIPEKDIEFDPQTDEFGNHGYDRASFICKCGEYHSVTIEEW